MTRTLMAAGAALALFASPVLADDISDRFAPMTERCGQDFSLICATPVEDMTFADLVNKTPLVNSVPELLEINGIVDDGTITGTTPVPRVMLAVARMG